MKTKNLTTFLIFLLASVYFISQFLRSALGITAFEISSFFGLDYEQVGRLGGVFFLSFALMQIPIGIILDKFNPLKVIMLMLIIIYFGTSLLSFGGSFELIFLARILQGIGCSVCLMGPLVYLAKNSPKETFSKHSGIIMGLGGLGALFAFSPFYELTLLVGWQKSFFIFSFLILFIILVLAVRKSKKTTQKYYYKKTNISTFIFIFTDKNFLKILPMSIFGYASFAFLLTLWGSKFLSLKKNISDSDSAIILMLMAFFWTIGSIVFGITNNKIAKNKTIVIFSAFALASILIMLALFSIESYPMIVIIFCLYGFLGAFTLVVLDHYRKLFDAEILGKVLTSANLFNFGGVFFIQWITGLIIEYSTNKSWLTLYQGFAFSFLVIAFSLFFSIIFYFKTDESK